MFFVTEKATDNNFGETAGWQLQMRKRVGF